MTAPTPRLGRGISWSDIVEEIARDEANMLCQPLTDSTLAPVVD